MVNFQEEEKRGRWAGGYLDWLAREVLSEEMTFEFTSDLKE